MKKITDMVQQTKLKFRQRGRMRTTTKLVMLFSISSFISLTIALFYFFNFSNVKDLHGTEFVPAKVVNGRMEVLDKEMPTDFEVKELDMKSPTAANDTVVLFKKMKP